MEVFNKELRKNDIQYRLSVPSRSLQYIDFAGEFSVDLRVKDSRGELRIIRYRKRHGHHTKPELSRGWHRYVTDYELRVGDRVALLAEEDHCLGSQFRIEAKRRIILFGEEAWVIVNAVRQNIPTLTPFQQCRRNLLVINKLVQTSNSPQSLASGKARFKGSSVILYTLYKQQKINKKGKSCLSLLRSLRLWRYEPCPSSFSQLQNPNTYIWNTMIRGCS
ncbi:hypothetical protein SADUNF_Sadunf01G0174600 [Salix dunnii]|uniref:TF-B3 domain-containing protein n=1 Tax=Salix dunnii TaxID=1413687 RepID=A0A835NBZ2_9ROSI|nr:hypothetical protein SADUNF_Sadunf01G0174600 [Salix dunnii]